MKDNRVSVIVPAFNAAHSLGRCLESILSQELKPTQIIVVNDGSEDNTREVATSYGHQIVYVEQQNQGQGPARNAGLTVVNGRFIAFLDADDFWLPDFLKETTSFLLAHPKAVAVSTGYVIRKWGKEHRGPAGLRNDGGNGEGYLLENFFETWAEHDHVRTGTVLIRGDVIEKAGPQLEIRISQDMEYWGYLATFGKWGFIPEPLWVGDSRSAAAAYGWLAKYKKRRQLCPMVEQWQRRIIPRLTGKDWAGFRIVRGRIAKNFAHFKLLAGKNKDALSIVLKYGRDFPNGSISKVMKFGARNGAFVWRIICFLLRFRERLKGFLISLTHRVDTTFAK